MTSRGNSSRSPPVQISQPRQVNALPSGTPPPQQQFFAGQAQLGQPQVFEFHSQAQQGQQGGQQLTPYQAYGSAPNDPRVNGGSGRGAPPQGIPPQGGAFYHQPGQTMRPNQTPQSQQAVLPLQYYVSAPQPPQSNIRQRPQLFMIQQPAGFPAGTNVVVPSHQNVVSPQYPRVPLFTPQNPPYQTYGGHNNYQMYYPTNGNVVRGGHVMAQGGAAPPSREKKILVIKDPTTGRNVTDEICNRPQSADSVEQAEEPPNNPANNEVRQEFASRVAELIQKNPKLPGGATSMGATAMEQPSQSVESNGLPQQYQQLPPPQQSQSMPAQQQQQPQQVAPNMIRPMQQHPRMMQQNQHMHQHMVPNQGQPGMMPPNSGASPEMMGHGRPPINLAVPPPSLPPQVRQPTPAQIYHQPQHGPRHPQQPQTGPNVRTPGPPVAMTPTPPPQQTAASAQQQQPMQQQQSPMQQQQPHPPQQPHPAQQPLPPQQTFLPQQQSIPPQQQSIPPQQAAQPPQQASQPPQQPAHNPQQPPQQSSYPSQQQQSSVVTTPQAASVVLPAAAVSLQQTVTSDSSAVSSVPIKRQVSQEPIKPVPEVTPVAQDSENIPPKLASAVMPPAPAEKAPSPPKDVPKPAEPVPAPVPQIKPKEQTPPVKEDSPIKSEDSSGASTQSKDVRSKGKKKGKDINRKEFSGSDMDAFIDGKDTESIETKPPLPPSVVERQTSTEKSPAAIPPKAFSYAAAATESPKPKESSPKPSPPVEESTQVKDQDPPKKESGPDPVVPPTPVEVPPAEEKAAVNQNQAPTKAPTPTPEKVPATAPSPAPATPPAPITPPAEPAPEPEKVKQKEPSPEVEPQVKTSVAPPLETKPPLRQPTKENDENEPPKDSIPKQEENTRRGNPPMEENGPVKDNASLARNKKEANGGKLTYDRAYLMELKDCAYAQAKPDGLPDLEVILEKPHPDKAKSGNMAGPADFTPSFFQPGVGNQRHAPPMGKSSSRGRQRPDMQMPPKIITRVSISNDVKLLHQSEKPWKPSKKGDKDVEKSMESEALFILNRLTPTNFEKLAHEMRSLAVNDYDSLVALVKVVFDKVTLETKFVEAYALLCKVMSQMKVPPPPNMKENSATFRVVMLTKCQQEFESDKSVIFEDPEEKKKKILSEMPESPERQEFIENTLYQMKLKRLKFYGNIRFIGELFKLGMLTDTIMHDCIFRLLKARDDDSLVSLCNLITTVGQRLDTDKAKTRMDQYFVQMAKISDERKSRIKFTLKDVIDLRNNNWKPRKEQTGPKKIHEVHKDFEQEQATKQYMANQPPPPRNDPQPGSRRGSRQRQEEKPTDDGWNTVGSRSLRIDASKMRLSKQNVVDENIQLGPGGGMNKFSMWGRGSFGGGGQQQQQSQDDRQAPSNRFSALRDDGRDKRQFERSPSRGDGRGMRQNQPLAGHGRGRMMARSSQEGDRRDALASARSIVGGGRSQNSSRESSWNREDRRQMFGPRGSREADNPMTRSDITPRREEEFRAPAPPPPPAQVVKKVKEISDEEMEKKSKNILEEYLSIRDLNEAKLCVEELQGQPKLWYLVTNFINETFERSASAREQTGALLQELVKANIITIDMYIQGLSDTLGMWEDLVIDIPKFFPYVVQTIVPLLTGGSLTMEKFVSVCKSAMDKVGSCKLLAPLMELLKEKVGEEKAAQMWQSSGASWADFMPAGEVDQFLKDKKIEFVNKSVSGAGSSTGGLDYDRLTTTLENMVRDKRSNKEVIAYIEKTVQGETQNKLFIRALMTAIASSSISRPPSAPKVSEEIIKARKDILQAYIRSNTDLELQALYAIQALMAKLEHPSMVINCLFDTLYDEDVISEESCKLWEKSTDPNEQEGKGACSIQLTRFFTWLRENEDPEAAS